MVTNDPFACCRYYENCGVRFPPSKQLRGTKRDFVPWVKIIESSETLLLSVSGPQMIPWGRVYTIFGIRVLFFSSDKTALQGRTDVWLLQKA